MGGVRSVAEKVGCSSETLRHWVRQTERDQGRRPGLTTDERALLKDQAREIRELRRANEILLKASAYFAQAELDRRPRQWWRSSTPIARRPGSSRSAPSYRSPIGCVRGLARGKHLVAPPRMGASMGQENRDES